MCYTKAGCSEPLPPAAFGTGAFTGALAEVPTQGLLPGGGADAGLRGDGAAAAGAGTGAAGLAVQERGGPREPDWLWVKHRVTPTPWGSNHHPGVQTNTTRGVHITTIQIGATFLLMGVEP